MVASQCLFDEVVDLACTIDFILRGTFVEDIVEVELAMVLPLRHLHLTSASIGPNAAVHIAILDLIFEKGTDADTRLDLTAVHLIILLGTRISVWIGQGGCVIGWDSDGKGGVYKVLCTVVDAREESELNCNERMRVWIVPSKCDSSKCWDCNLSLSTTSCFAGRSPVPIYRFSLCHFQYSRH